MLFVVMAPLKFFANFQIKLFFHGQGQSNTSMVSLSPSHVLPPALLIVFESSNPCAHELLTKKPKRTYDKFQIFQNSWAAKFPWVESVLGEDF
jgi:predicted esterase